MAKNLKQKIALLLEDVETLSRSETISRIEELINNEIKFLESTHIVSAEDLSNIRSSAVAEYTRRDVTKELGEGYIITDMDMVQALCYTYSVINHLRGKDLINFELKFSRKKGG